MSKKTFLAHVGTPQNIDFDPHGSGRYRQGSGDNPHQHGFDLLYEIDKMKKSGLYKNETEIARALGYSSGELRAIKTNLISEKYASDAAKALKLKEKGWSYVRIGQELGVSDKTVKNMLENPNKMKDEILESTADVIRKSLKEHKYIDIGEGVERSLGIPRTKFDAAIQKIKMEGEYEVKNLQVQQINAPIGQKTSLLVLVPKGTPTREVYENMGDISLIKEYHSEDLGQTYGYIEKPQSISSSRIEVKYADANGFQPKDGVIELRPGVEDITLGQSKYAQVRIAVDDKYYIKGMALYSNDLPKGVDIRVNTNKMEGTPLEKVLKPLNRTAYLENGDPDPNSPVDWKNPFGATIKAGGQIPYTDKDGNRKLSVINKVNEEGDWGEWDKTLAAQFLSKQSYDLAKKQLNITYLGKKEEFEDIKSISNSEIRKKMLFSFADDCDASAVDLKAAAMPRQATQVILPLNSMKETEIFAPNFKNGEHVCLVRYPHSGPSEIPNLVVNNNHKEAVSLFGKNPKDCVVINPKVAAQLAGADFDGDSVVVIPNKKGIINSTKPLKDLKDFDPHIAYKGYEGMKVMPKKIMGTEMGKIANLITDMTTIGCTEEELARAIKHSMVVVDAPKHKLDWKRSEKENRIPELKKKYQGAANAGAGTLISRAKSQEHVPQRKLYIKVDPKTGEKIYTPTGESFIKTWKLKDGTIRTKEEIRTTKSTKMAEADDAFKIASDPNNPYTMEIYYGKYANQMKKMANEARLEATKIKTYQVNPSAKNAYSKEILSLDTKLNDAKMNAPYERKAQMAANVILKQKKIANPNMTDSEKKKIGQNELNNARARLIPGGRKKRIVLTEKELEAINANAIPASHLKDILNNADQDILKEMVMPKKQVRGLSNAKIASAKAKLASGYYTQAEIAEELGISPTTLRKYLE